MRLEEMLGIDPERPEDRHARALVVADDELIRDLVELREREGLSQADVARRMGVDPSAVSRIETGTRDLRQSTLRRYAYAVGAVVHHQVRSAARERRAEAVLKGHQHAADITRWSEAEDAVARMAQRTLARGRR